MTKNVMCVFFCFRVYEIRLFYCKTCIHRIAFFDIKVGVYANALFTGKRVCTNGRRKNKKKLPSAKKRSSVYTFCWLAWLGGLAALAGLAWLA